jgi:hypothetical protein
MNLVNIGLTSEGANGSPGAMIQFKNLLLRGAVIWLAHGACVHGRRPDLHHRNKKSTSSAAAPDSLNGP